MLPMRTKNRLSEQKQYNTSLRICRLAEGWNNSVEVDDAVAGSCTFRARILLVRWLVAAPGLVGELKVVTELEPEECSSSLASERASKIYLVEAISLKIQANSP